MPLKYMAKFYGHNRLCKIIFPHISGTHFLHPAEHAHHYNHGVHDQRHPQIVKIGRDQQELDQRHGAYNNQQDPQHVGEFSNNCSN